MSETTTEREWHEISVGDYVVAWRRSLGDSSIAQVLIGDDPPDEWWPVALLEALSTIQARAQAATGLYEALREIVAKVALKLPMYAIEYDKACKAIADYEKVMG